MTEHEEGSKRFKDLIRYALDNMPSDKEKATIVEVLVGRVYIPQECVTTVIRYYEREERYTDAAALAKRAEEYRRLKSIEDT